MSSLVEFLELFAQLVGFRFQLFQPRFQKHDYNDDGPEDPFVRCDASAPTFSRSRRSRRRRAHQGRCRIRRDSYQLY